MDGKHAAYQVVRKFLRRHTNASVRDDNPTALAVLILHGFDRDVEGRCTIVDAFINERSQPKLLNCIIRVREQFAQEDVSVRVKTKQ